MLPLDEQAVEVHGGRFATWVAAATTVALGLRLVRIGSESLWRDETFQWWSTTFTWAEILRNASGDVHPPLYALLTKVFVGVFGDAEWALRLPAALLTAAAVPLIAALGRRAGGPRAGVLSAWIAALAPALVRYGQEARSYGLLVFASAFALVTLSRTIDLGGPAPARPRDVAILALAAAILAFSHPYGPLAVAGIGLFLTVTTVRDRRFPTGAVIGLAAAGLVFASYTPVLRSQIAAVREGFWITPLPPANILAVPGSMLRRGTPRPLTALFAVVVLLAAKRLPPRWRLLAASLALTVWIGPAVHSYLGQPLFEVNYAFALAPLAVVSLGVAVARLDGQRRRIAAAVLLAGLAIDSVAYLLGGPRKEPWREACAPLVTAARDGATAVLVRRPGRAGIMERSAVLYYARGLPLHEVEAVTGRGVVFPPGRLAVGYPPVHELDDAIRAALGSRSARSVSARPPLALLLVEGE